MHDICGFLVVDDNMIIGSGVRDIFTLSLALIYTQKWWKFTF